MRRIIWFVAVFGVIWCLWWAGASAVLRIGVDRWLEARQAEGWQAEVDDIAGGGFPTELVALLRAPRLADPDTGVAVSTSRLTLRAAAWWPGFARLELPSDPIRLAGPDGFAELLMTDSAMQMDLEPGTALVLQTLAWTAGPWGLTADGSALVSADDLTLAMQQDERPDAYSFDIQSSALRPGDGIRDQLRIPDDWPVAFDRLLIDMDVTFDRPWDIRSLEQRRPQPRQVDLHLAEAHWGDVRLNVAANVTVDAQGIPTGDVALQAENWRDALIVASNAGLFPPQFLAQAERALGQFAELSGNPNALDISLQFRDGMIRLGFIPLGPAPRFILR